MNALSLFHEYKYYFLGEYSESAISKIDNYATQKNHRIIKLWLSYSGCVHTEQDIYEYYANHMDRIYRTIKTETRDSACSIIVYSDEKDPIGKNVILREVIGKFKEKHESLYIYSFSEFCSMGPDFGITALENRPVIERNNDPVSNPPHYTEGQKYEPRRVIYDWGLNFNLGNAVKYISRAGRKQPEKKKEDLEKAIQYIKFELEEMEEEDE